MHYILAALSNDFGAVAAYVMRPSSVQQKLENEATTASGCTTPQFVLWCHRPRVAEGLTGKQRAASELCSTPAKEHHHGGHPERVACAPAIIASSCAFVDFK